MHKKDSLWGETGWDHYFIARYNEAIEAFNEAIRVNPKSHYALRGRGWAYLQIGNYDYAIRDLSEAANYASSAEKGAWQEILRGLGWAHYHKGNFDKAIQSYNRILENKITNEKIVLQDIFRGLGWAYFRKDSFTEAIENFNKAIENINPDNKDVMQEACKGRESALQKKSLTEFGPPEIIEIEPTKTCNLRCIMCHVPYEKRANTLINVDFVNRLKGLEGKWVVIGSNYEPLTHPRFCDIILALSNLDMKIELITNGTLLTEEISNRLAKCNITNVIFSFDGIRKETYESIRKNAKYEQTMERILYFKNAIANKETFFAINNTLLKRNLDEVVEAVAFWERHGFDHIGFILMVIRNKTLERESLKPMMNNVYEKLDEAARHVIENKFKITLSAAAYNRTSALKQNHPTNFVASCVKSNNPKARTPFNPRTYFQLGYYPSMSVSCRSPFKFARILYNGNVELCYQFVVGNIYKDDFLDIWYGEKAKRIREMILRNPKVCYSCDYYRLCVKAGELDYNDEDSFYGELVHNKYRYPTIIEDNFYSYAIIAWLGDYYGVPPCSSHDHIALLLNDEDAKLKGVFIEESAEKVKDTIVSHLKGQNNSKKAIYWFIYISKTIWKAWCR